MLNVNNPAVNLETRSFLREEMLGGGFLDEQCLRLVEMALDRVRELGPSGWVYLLADSLGAARQDAIEAASVAEMYYAMSSFTDDVQDGDAAAYMGERDERVLMNTAAQLICLTASRACGFAARLGKAGASAEIALAFAHGSAMLTGQRIEMLRQRWSARTYERVASLSGGRQFEVYLRLAAMAARARPDWLLPLAEPLGILVQVRHDELSRDDRLLSLPAAAVASMRRRAERRLAQAVERAPRRALPVVRQMVAYATRGSGPRRGRVAKARVRL